jgi:thiol-disulfide isomerase/thioredoxin
VALSLLALSLLAVIVFLSRGVLISPAERTAVDHGPIAVDTAQLGEFVRSSRPRSAPQVSFIDTAGQTARLSDFAGKVVLLNLWATWCAPCRHEMPSLERLQTRFGDKITVLAVSEDIGGSKVVVPFIAKLGLRAIRAYLDPKSAVGQALKVDGLPTSFLIDRQGRVLGRVDGGAEWDSSKMLAIIEPLLAADDIVKTAFPRVHP